jgi:hypothetical protein
VSWCRVLSSPPPSSGKQQFLLLHADAAKFWAQHPLCYGVPLRSQGTPTNVALQVVLFYLVLYLYTWALASSPRPTIFCFFTLTHRYA